MNGQILVLDAIALIAGIAAVYLALKTQKRFGKGLKPAFQILTTVIALLLATVIARNIGLEERLLDALTNASIVAIMVGACIGMAIVNKKMPVLE